MCTHFVVNNKKTLVGWNLDLLDWEHRVRHTTDGVYIEIFDPKEGWLPLFGANRRGDFVGMPTCWPYDKRSEPTNGAANLLMLDIDLLLMHKTFEEIHSIVNSTNVCSVSGNTFMGALSDKDGNVLQIVPGQGHVFLDKPNYCILTNFSPFKQNKELHPWMGWDRYQIAKETLQTNWQIFDVQACFALLRAVSQEICPTVVSMVFDVSDKTVYWCENRNWSNVSSFHFAQ